MKFDCDLKLQAAHGAWRERERERETKLSAWLFHFSHLRSLDDTKLIIDRGIILKII